MNSTPKTLLTTLILTQIWLVQNQRQYSLRIETPIGGGCGSNANVGVYFINDCTRSSLTCSSTVATTSTTSFATPSQGSWASTTFSEADIGTITHMYLALTSDTNDAWCFRDFDVLIDDTVPIWANCSVSDIGYIPLDGDCSLSIAATSIIIDVSEDSRLCDYFYPPTMTPTTLPTTFPTATPSEQPTAAPSMQPTATPSKQPTASPSLQPTDTPTRFPSSFPSNSPTHLPTRLPSEIPTAIPSFNPIATGVPSSNPSKLPSNEPSGQPTVEPSESLTTSSLRYVQDVCFLCFCFFVFFVCVVFLFSNQYCVV